MAFKMKGWGGNQKPSPIEKYKTPRMHSQPMEKPSPMDNKLKDALTKIKNKLTEDINKIKSKMPDFSQGQNIQMTREEKDQAAKIGLSEYQWKSNVGLSGWQRHKKRMWETKMENDPSREYISFDKRRKGVDIEEMEVPEAHETPVADESSYQPPTAEPIGEEVEATDDAVESILDVDFGEGAISSDYHQESSTGWSLHELTQERNKHSKGSAEWQHVQDAINEAYELGGYRSEVITHEEPSVEEPIIEEEVGEEDIETPSDKDISKADIQKKISELMMNKQLYKKGDTFYYKFKQSHPWHPMGISGKPLLENYPGYTWKTVKLSSEKDLHSQIKNLLEGKIKLPREYTGSW